MERGKEPLYGFPGVLLGILVLVLIGAALRAFSAIPLTHDEVIRTWHGRPPEITLDGKGRVDSWIATKIGQASTIVIKTVKGQVRTQVISTTWLPNRVVRDGKDTICMYDVRLADTDKAKSIAGRIVEIYVEGNQVFHLTPTTKVAQPLVTPVPYDRKRDGPKPYERMMQRARDQVFD